MGSMIGSMKNVKIFVLYLMENVGTPLSFVTLNDIVMQTDYIMYLDFAEAFHKMLDDGLIATVAGRGYAARLLDNESRPMTYETATLEEIVRNHVTPYGITAAEIGAVRATAPYTVAAGTSQWKALENFCRTYGGFSPRFSRTARISMVRL